jgi:hypothetical protein
MFLSCCYKKKEKIKVICQYCNVSPYSKYIYEDFYYKSLTIKELKKITLEKINTKQLFMINYKKIYFINIKDVNDNQTLDSLNKNEILIIYDLE